MTQLNITVDSKQVEAKLEQLQSRMQNTKPVMAGIAAELLSLTEKSFDKQGHPTKWQSLAASTISQREKEGTWPGKILQISTAGLAASITPFHTSDTAGISSSKPYAAIHQFGGQAGRGRKVTIPARPYMPIDADKKLTPEAEESIMSMMRDYFSFE